MRPSILATGFDRSAKIVLKMANRERSQWNGPGSGDSEEVEIPFGISIAQPCRIAQGRMQFASTRFLQKTALG
jgi:hypothetical protein